MNTCARAKSRVFQKRSSSVSNRIVLIRYLCYSLAVFSLAVLSLGVLDLDEDDLSFSFLLSLEQGLALIESINRAVPIKKRYPAIPTPTIRNESAH
jgi:hypothetical protein